MTTLVDTSAWIDFLRGESAAVKRVDPLLTEGAAALCGPVRAEVLSGARDRALFDRLSRLFDALTYLETDEDAWREVAELRFLLARQGVQAHLIDLLIAVTAVAQGAVLVTRDRDFERIARVLPVELHLF
jgi:predicted nucleic acid-binding protein